MDAKAQRRKGENELSRRVIGAAIEVHRRLGPGLLEAIYEECLCVELRRLRIPHERQKPVPIVYREVLVGPAYRLDLLVGGILVVEIKATETRAAIHAAQLLTYLRLTGCRLGLVINFGLQTVREGIERVVNNLLD